MGEQKKDRGVGPFFILMINDSYNQGNNHRQNVNSIDDQLVGNLNFFCLIHVDYSFFYFFYFLFSFLSPSNIITGLGNYIHF